MGGRVNLKKKKKKAGKYRKKKGKTLNGAVSGEWEMLGEGRVEGKVQGQLCSTCPIGLFAS